MKNYTIEKTTGTRVFYNFTEPKEKGEKSRSKLRSAKPEKRKEKSDSRRIG